MIPADPSSGMPSTAPTPTPADRAGEDDIPGARMAALTAYTQINRERFTEAALRTAALGAGYTAAEFERAWAAVASSRPEDAIRPVTSRRAVVGTTIAFIVGTWLSLSLAESLTLAIGIPGPGAIVAWVIAGIAGSVGWFALRERNPSVSKGLGCGVIVVVVFPAVLFVAALGVCLATGSISGFRPN